MALNFKHLGFGLAVVLAGLATTSSLWQHPPGQPVHAVATALGAVAAPPADILQAAASAPAPVQNMAAATRRSGSALELSHDLRSIYDQYENSNDAAERYTAYRAWSACFPTFVSPEGQLAPLEALTHALPNSGPQRAFRVDAYRVLQARCRHFADMSRGDIANGSSRQQAARSHDTAISPGELAQKYLTEGNKETALKTMRAIVASGDPFAISSLREFVNQYMVLRIDAQTTYSDERPDLRSQAFTMAACQMGMDCGAASLTALQLCTSMGECSGSVADRYLQALPNQADRDALAVETKRVLDAITSGNFKALGLQ